VLRTARLRPAGQGGHDRRGQVRWSRYGAGEHVRTDDRKQLLTAHSRNQRDGREADRSQVSSAAPEEGSGAFTAE
jgi:hypothetical protein